MREPCYKCRFEYKPIDIEPCEHCSDEYMKSGDHPAFQWAKSPTNADRIRAMTDEELAELISERVACSECKHMYAGEGRPCHNGKTCPDYWLDWLKEEVAPYVGSE